MERGQKFLNGLFGNKTETKEDGSVNVALVEEKLGGLEVDQLAREVSIQTPNTTDPSGNPHEDELEDAFFDMSQAPLCSKNTREFLATTSDNVVQIPSGDTYAARGVERGRKLTLSENEAQASKDHYTQTVVANGSIEPADIWYNINNPNPEQTIPNGIAFIEKQQQAGCNFFDIRITGVSLTGENVGIGHRVPAAVNANGELRLFDRVVTNFKGDSDGVTLGEYTDRMIQRGKTDPNKQIAILGIAAYKATQQPPA